MNEEDPMCICGHALSMHIDGAIQPCDVPSCVCTTFDEDTEVDDER